MGQETDQDLQAWEEAYLSALALYEILRASDMIKVERAQIVQGEVKALPIDFKCDLELRAKETLSEHNELLLWWDVLEEPERYPNLPKGMQQDLGRAFVENDLGVEGHYRMLYFRVKNEIERKKLGKEIENEPTTYGGQELESIIELGDISFPFPRADEETNGEGNWPVA